MCIFDRTPQYGVHSLVSGRVSSKHIQSAPPHEAKCQFDIWVLMA